MLCDCCTLCTFCCGVVLRVMCIRNKLYMKEKNEAFYEFDCILKQIHFKNFIPSKHLASKLSFCHRKKNVLSLVG